MVARTSRANPFVAVQVQDLRALQLLHQKAKPVCATAASVYPLPRIAVIGNAASTNQSA